MATEDDDNPEAARTRLLELLEGDDWEFSKPAKAQGKLALRWLRNREPTECEMVEYVISLLKGNTTLRRAPQGDPPGSGGIGWQTTDPRNVFFKLQICEIRFGQEFTFVQSIHESVHPK